MIETTSDKSDSGEKEKDSGGRQAKVEDEKKPDAKGKKVRNRASLLSEIKSSNEPELEDSDKFEEDSHTESVHGKLPTLDEPEQG